MEVPQKVALHNPSKNRNDRYLPGIILLGSYMHNKSAHLHLPAGDQWRVTLRGDKVDYIHAVFVDVNACIT